MSEINVVFLITISSCKINATYDFFSNKVMCTVLTDLGLLIRYS